MIKMKNPETNITKETFNQSTNSKLHYVIYPLKDAKYLLSVGRLEQVVDPESSGLAKELVHCSVCPFVRLN